MNEEENKNNPIWVILLCYFIRLLFPILLVASTTFLAVKFDNLNLLWWYIAAILCYIG